MDKCSRCDQVAKYFRRTGVELFFACDTPKHIRVQGGLSCDWRGVGALQGTALATARKGAAIMKIADPTPRSA